MRSSRHDFVAVARLLPARLVRVDDAEAAAGELRQRRRLAVPDMPVMDSAHRGRSRARGSSPRRARSAGTSRGLPVQPSDVAGRRQRWDSPSASRGAA